MGRHEEALKILHGGTVIPAIRWFWTKTGNSTRRASAR